MSVVKNNPAFTDEPAAPAAVEPELVEEESAETEEESEAEETTTEETPVADPITPVVEEPVVPAKVKIGEKEYTQDELNELVTKGSKIKDWETKMPGFDVDKFMPDYTQKSQRLAAIDKRPAQKEVKLDPKELETMGIDDAQIKAFEKVAKHLGFVKNTDLVQDSIEAQKEAFIAQHPEYAPGTPVNDAKWGKLIEEFQLYNWQSNPGKVGSLLERAHSEVSKAWVEQERGGKVQEVVTTQKAKAAAAAMGGGGGKGAPAKAPAASNTDMAEKFRAMGWSEADIKEILP